MSIKFNNETNMPINIRLTNAGITYHHHNTIQPGESKTFDVAAIGWDAWACYDNGQNRYDPKKDNVGVLSGIILGTVGGIIGVAGLALIPFTAGLSAAATGWGIATAVAGAASAIAAIGFSIAGAVMYPAMVQGLYGGDGYDISVHGGFAGTYIPATNTYRIDKVSPIKLSWKNLKTGTHGDVDAPTSS